MSLSQAADLLYHEYRQGRFPMAETADDPFMIVVPHERALLPIRDLHIPRSLLKAVRSNRFEIRIDSAFDAVIAACAEARPERPETWINPDIRLLFNELHRQGRAHSVECWENNQLVGGLYGLQVGGAFCGESMFSRVTDASKVALVYLCACLDAAGFVLLDAQFHNPHLEQFGLQIVTQQEYVKKLQGVRDLVLNFPLSTPPQDLLARFLNLRNS